MPYDTNSPPPLATQSAALHALASTADAHPDLPGAYVVTHVIDPGQIDIQLDSPADLETWRESLGIAAHDLTLKHYDARRHLEFTAPLGAVLLRAYAIFPDSGFTPEGSRP